MIGRLASGLASMLLVLTTAARAQAQAVALFEACPVADAKNALAHELSVIGAEVESHAGPLPDGSSTHEELARRQASVLLVVDPACTAHIYGERQTSYTFALSADASAWAVRVAETVYALLPYGTNKALVKPTPAPPPSAKTDHPLTHHVAFALAVGPALISGTNGVRALASGQAVWSIGRLLELALRAGGIIPSARVGDDGAGARLSWWHGSVDVRARFALSPRALALALWVGAGPLFTRARGTARAPRTAQDQTTWTALVSAGLELSYLLRDPFGLIAQLAVSSSLPPLELELGGGNRQRVHELEGHFVLGPMLRF